METTNTTKSCECGCGEAVARRFKPGHDAKLKSLLVQSVSASQWWVRQSAAEALLERGWLHFAKPEALADLKVRSRGSNGRFVETRHVEVVETADWTHLDERGHTHAHPGCSEVVGSLTAERSATGWLCSTCVHTEDWLDLAARHNKDAWLDRTPGVVVWEVPANGVNA